MDKTTELLAIVAQLSLARDELARQAQAIRARLDKAKIDLCSLEQSIKKAKGGPKRP